MGKYAIDKTTLDGMADAVRGLTGASGNLSPADMTAAINGYVPPHDWMGRNCTLVDDSLYTATVYLKNTNFPTWTASTTATVIKDSVDDKVVQVDLGNYEYILEWLWCVDDAQLAGATMKAMPDRSYGAFYQVVHRRPYGQANFASETSSYNYCTALYTSAAYNIYYNSSGNISWTTSMYGVYCVNTAATLSSTSSLTPSLTTKSPNITARCHSSYFATDRKAEIDADNTIIKMKGNLYRVDLDTSPLKNMYMAAVHLYSTPL